MIPDQILLWVYVFSALGAAAAGLGAVLLAVHLRMEVFGAKSTLVIILASLIAWYMVPFIYVWTMRNAYFHELISDYPVRMHQLALGFVLFPLALWLGQELEKRRTKDKGRNDE